MSSFISIGLLYSLKIAAKGMDKVGVVGIGQD